jgi:hypothetical protein
VAVPVHRLVHRYVGREHGGHRCVGASLTLPREVETVIHRRSDLAGEDLGRPVGPYLCGYPLPDGRYALARTTYLTDADCLGAVRTETLLVETDAQAALVDPLTLAGAFDLRPDPTELRRFQEARAVAALAPAQADPDGGTPQALLASLAGLDHGILERVVAGLVGARPLALIGTPATGPTPEQLLRALLHLAPEGAAWRLAWCALALSHRPWAQLQLVPSAASDRFALRAAREADVATVELARGDLRNVEPGPLATTLVEWLVGGAWEPLLGLRARAGACAALRAPADLGAQLHFEALARKADRTPEEQVELANLLHARGAPPSEVAEPFRQLLRSPPEGRLVWVMNVVSAGWLGYRRAHPDAPGEPEAALALLRRALAAQRFDLARGFLEKQGPLDPQVRRAIEDEALALALGEAPLQGEASSPTTQGLVGLLVDRAGRDARAAVETARAFAHRAPVAPTDALVAVAARLVGPGRAPDAATLGPLRVEGALALVDAAAAAGARPLVSSLVLGLVAEAGRGADEVGDAELGEAYGRVAALADDELVHAVLRLHPLERPRPLERFLRRLQGAPLLSTALDTLARRGPSRPLVRAAVRARRAGVVGARERVRAQLLSAALSEGRTPEALVRAAARRVRAGAWGRAAADLEVLDAHRRPPAPGLAPGLAPGPAPGPAPELAPGLAPEPATGRFDAVPPRATGRLDQDSSDGGQRTGVIGPGALEASERTGILDAGALTGAIATWSEADLADGETGMGLVRPVNPGGPPGDSASVKTEEVAAWQELLTAASAAPGVEHAPIAEVLGRAPAAAWAIPLGPLCALAPRAGACPAHAAALGAAARAWTASTAPLPPGEAPARAAAAALAALAPDAPPVGVTWIGRAAEVAAALGLGPEARTEREALARAAAARTTPQELAHAAPLLEPLGRPASLARALVDAALRVPPARGDRRGAEGPELEVLRRGLAALDPATLAADAPLVEALARRAREGRLPLDALATPGPRGLDAVLARALDGAPSVGLQQGLRTFLLGLAEGQAPERHELIRVGLARLQPQVAPDRAFRRDVAAALRQRLPGLQPGEPLARTLTSFET